jgi:hypothetical protein
MTESLYFLSRISLLSSLSHSQALSEQLFVNWNLDCASAIVERSSVASTELPCSLDYSFPILMRMTRLCQLELGDDWYGDLFILLMIPGLIGIIAYSYSKILVRSLTWPVYNWCGFFLGCV